MWHYIIKALIFFGIAFLLALIVKYLYKRPINIYDEAVYACNAVELTKHGNPLVYTIDGKVDQYNSKPPLVICLQAASCILFGYSEFSVRVPTFLALLLLLFVAWRFCNLFTASSVAGYLAMFLILVSNGLIRNHVFLSADLDATLTLISTCIFLFFYWLHCHKEQMQAKHWWLLLALFLAGYFAKSTAILLIIPSLVAVVALDKNIWHYLKQKKLYAMATLFFTIIIVYYIIREQVDPGHWQVVYFSEIKRYSLNIMPWHKQPCYFYFVNIFQKNKLFVITYILIAIPYYALATTHKYLNSRLLIMAIVYLLVLSYPEVKLDWYDAPIYPLLAISFATMMVALQKCFIEKKQKWSIAISSLLISSVIVFCASAIIDIKAYMKQAFTTLQPQEQEGIAVAMLSARLASNNKLSLLRPAGNNKIPRNEALVFYKDVLQHKNNIAVEEINSLTEANNKSAIILPRDVVADTFLKNFSKIDSCGEFFLFTKTEK